MEDIEKVKGSRFKSQVSRSKVQGERAKGKGNYFDL
jgi:hypothetical protein